MSPRKKARARYSQIVAQLAALSRNGWALAKPADYQPLEQELRTLAVLLFGPEPALVPVKVRK